MPPKVIEYLKKERLAVLSIVEPDGTIDSATMHFSHQENPVRLFFQTGIKTGKIARLINSKFAQASVTIGFSENDWLTLQMKGTIQTITGEKEKLRVENIHYLKYSRLIKYANSADVALLEFIPTWWRFSDYNMFPPDTLSSEDKI